MKIPQEIKDKAKAEAGSRYSELITISYEGQKKQRQYQRRFIEGAEYGYSLAVPELEAKDKRIKELEGLLTRASGLVGNPGTNISGSTDIACDDWQKDYKQLLNK